MSRPNPMKLAAVLVALAVLSSLSILLKGGLYVSNFEGDALHLADIVSRISIGQQPHLDFMSPIGHFAVWPIAVFHGQGMSFSNAYAAAQGLVALLLVPAIVRAAASRLPRITGWAFGIVCVLLVTSLAHGDEGAITAISMHYNRWAWAMAFIACVLCVLPVRHGRALQIDGVIVGLLLAAMAFIKVTYLVAFGPVLALIVLLRRDGAMLLSGAAAFAAAFAVYTFLVGPAQIIAYVGDVRATVDAPLRDAPGEPLVDLIVSPAYIAATLTLLGGALTLRRRGREVEGLSILLLFPAFLVVTWQNHGNDPVWLVLLAVMFAAIWDVDRRLTGLALAAVAALALAAPSLAVHMPSTARHLLEPADRYTPLIPNRTDLADVQIPNLPAHLVRARHVLNEEGAPFAALADRFEGSDPVIIGDRTLAECQVMTGIKGTLELIAGDAAGTGTFLVADIISAHWLYTESDPLPDGAPWNYGTLDGAANAQTLVVPLCPVSVRAREHIIEALEEAGASLALTGETDRALFYSLQLPSTAPSDR